MAFVAGPYKWYWQGLELGVVEEPPQLEITHFGQPINADFFGGNPIDYIYLGAQVFLDLVLQEYNRAAVTNLLTQFTSSYSANVQATGVTGMHAQTTTFARIGCPVVTNYGDVLAADAVSSSCAFPLYWGSMRAALALDSPVSFAMGTRLKNVPIRFQLFPYEYETDNGNFWYWQESNVASFKALLRTDANSVQQALNAPGW